MSQTTSATPALSLSGISKTYPGVRALRDVGLEVSAGTVHAVLGENGAGKSTLVGIAVGSIVPDSGTIGLDGGVYGRLKPAAARDKGLAIVYQTPALAPALTVLDAVLLLLPARLRPRRSAAAAWLRAHFDGLGVEVDPTALVSSLSQRQAHLIEIAAALASEPSVLVLDEPTEALGPDETLWLFDRIRELLSRNAAVVYITHRIPEVIEIATEMTVLRDGRVVGRGKVSDYSADQIVELIVGRSLETTFPSKASASDGALVTLEVRDLVGRGLAPVSFSLRQGEIVGIAGVEGNGQRQFLRTLAGVDVVGGSLRVAGSAANLRSVREARHSGIVFLPGDRIGEAMFGKMTIRENILAPALSSVSRVGFTDRGKEYRTAQEAIAGLALKAPHLETSLTSLSGGSQQKVLLARGRLGNPRVLLVEDPTQGVDAGARVEIYAFLRALADSGVAVVVLSTDAVELEGLCDVVLVFSRGRVATELRGSEITERAITGSAVLSEAHDDVAVSAIPERAHRRRPGILAEPQALILLSLTIVLAVGTTAMASAFLSPLSVGNLFSSTSTVILVGLAQLLVVMTGGIDLSIGSVVALSGVVLSFFGQAGPAYFLVGVVLAVATGFVVGLANGVLTTRLSLPPVIATLVTSIAIVGVAQLLRPNPGGTSSADIMRALGTSIAGVPLVFVFAVGIAVTVWVILKRSALGRGFRAAGSNAVIANRMGVNVGAMRFVAAVGAAVLSALAGLTFYSASGIGDANSGQEFTLLSVTAIVIAAVSIFGGSGSGLAVAAAALLLQTITSALSFLSLGLSWQYWMQGGFVLLAAAVPAALLIARRRTRTSLG